MYEADDAVNERAVDNEGERYERGLNGFSFGDRQGSYSPHHQLGRLTDRDTGGKGSVHLSADDRGDASNSKSISRSGRKGHLKFHDREDTTKSRSSDGSRGKGENFDFRGRAGARVLSVLVPRATEEEAPTTTTTTTTTTTMINSVTSKMG